MADNQPTKRKQYNFSAGIPGNSENGDAVVPIMNTTSQTQAATPVLNTPEITANEEKNQSHKGLPDGWKRETYIVREEYIERLKDVAYWSRKPLKEVVDEAFGAYLADYQKMETRPDDQRKREKDRQGKRK